MKIDFTVTYENGDTQHTHTEDTFVEGDDAAFLHLCEDLQSCTNPQDALKLLHKSIKPGTFIYESLLKIFDYRGHIKLDWDDVMVSFNRVTVGSKSFDITEDSITANNPHGVSSVQLWHDDSRYQMHFIDEF